VLYGKTCVRLCLTSQRILSQVFDLQDEECRPAKVLRKLWDNLDAAIAAGDRKSAYFKQNLRVVAAGGDGTVAWILGTIRQARQQCPNLCRWQAHTQLQPLRQFSPPSPSKCGHPLRYPLFQGTARKDGYRLNLARVHFEGVAQSPAPVRPRFILSA
jgi:hypothetical protein